MTDEPHRFRLIQGGPKKDGKPRPRAYRARKRGELGLLTCPICEKDTGTDTTMTLEVKQGRMIRDGKPEGGSKAIICVHCLSRGVVTKLV